VWPVVIHHRNPLADDRLQLIKVEERLRLRIQPAGMHVRALIPRQSLQQILTDGAEEPLHRTLIPARPQPGRLYRNPQPRTHTRQMLGHIDLAVIDNNRFRHDRRPGRTGQRSLDCVDVDQH
jgi:hypothetical protein